jgi:hypothetical protein
MNMSLTQYRNQPKPSKYRNKRVILTADGTLFEVDELKRHNIDDVKGIKFDSKSEARYYLSLLQMQRDGEIIQIELQPVFILQEKPRIKYVADFEVKWADGTVEVLDVKGVQTAAFRLKSKLYKAMHPSKPLMIVTREGREWKVREVS